MNSTERTKILATLHEVRDLIEDYVDVKDGENTYGQPVANDAMKAAQLLDELLADVSSTPTLQPNASRRLQRLTDARSALPTVEACRAFDAFLIGALSTHVDDEEWASCLKTALGAIAREAVPA